MRNGTATQADSNVECTINPNICPQLGGLQFD